MNNDRVVRLGTRGSPLAIWQADRVSALLQAIYPDLKIEIIKIETKGDKILDKPMVQVGGKGIFTKEIENALLYNEIDLAVHSYKDLPTKQPDGLIIGAIPERENPFDAFFSPHEPILKALPEEPVIATGSLRRRAQVLALRPDATVVDIRGNVNTRVKKYEESDWDGMVMAMAGIVRMGWEDKISGILSPDEMVPAPAQGALAIEIRSDDSAMQTLVSSIHNAATAQCVIAERQFLAVLEGGCQVPIGAYGEVEKGEMTLTGIIANLDGDPCIRQSMTILADQAKDVGKKLAHNILAAGGQEILQELKSKND